MSTSLKDQITQAVKDAMRARDKARLGALRLIQADIQRVEVDERTTIDDTRVLAILDKMLKQRRDARDQYTDAGRQDLADQETAEIAVIETFMPQPLSEADIERLIETAIAETGASSVRDMGAVMAHLKPEAQGRADMGAISQRVKARLQG